ncbi:MAG: DUF3500 domain-containing protein [Desulforhopalus sp.]
MRRQLHLIIHVTTLMVLAVLPNRLSASPEQLLTDMNTQARQFLYQLEPTERANAQMVFSDRERMNWSYVPRARKGIALKSLSPGQRQAAFALVKSGLSAGGYEKARNIMSLESILREIEGSDYRDPELYFISIFGEPSEKSSWGWRIEGHHLSLNFTIAGNSQLVVTPNFWGANPAQVPFGAHKGLRPLALEEDTARKLLDALSTEQRQIAVVADRAPHEIITGTERRVTPLEVEGIGFAALDEHQREMLMAVIDTYLENFPSSIATQRKRLIEQSHPAAIHFSWHGSATPGERHYYRIQGETFLIEYDNFQNQANHIHTVWRDFDGDFGRDLLQEHLANHKHE